MMWLDLGSPPPFLMFEVNWTSRICEFTVLINLENVLLLFLQIFFCPALLIQGLQSHMSGHSRLSHSSLMHSSVFVFFFCFILDSFFDISSSSLIFSSAVFKSLIPFSIFFISDVVVLIPGNVIREFLYLTCLFLAF